MFKDPQGKTLTLNGIPLASTVAQVRKKLGEERAMEVEYFRFIWSGKQLDDGMFVQAGESYILVLHN
jgi:hypothetical protein